MSSPIQQDQRRVTIYAMSDPRKPALIRYIGKTINSLRQRGHQHIGYSKRKNTPKNQWILSLRKLGLRPLLWPLERCEFGSWEERERHWIWLFKPLGLLNLTDGGDSGPDMTGYRHTAESRIKIANAGRGRTHTNTPYQNRLTSIRNKLRPKEFYIKLHELGVAASTGKKRPDVSARFKGVRRSKKDIKLIRDGIIKSPKFIQWKKDYCSNVICKSTGEVFECIADAARAKNIPLTTLANAIRRGTRCKQLEWEKIWKP